MLSFTEELDFVPGVSSISFFSLTREKICQSLSVKIMVTDKLFIGVIMNLLCNLNLKNSEKHYSKRVINSVNPRSNTSKILINKSIKLVI